MSELTRNQEYTFQYKTVNVRDSFFGGHQPKLSVALPKNLLAIKNLYCHLMMTYDIAVPVGQRKLNWIGGNPQYTGGTIPNAAQPNMKYLGAVADVTTRKIDVKVDLSDIVSKLSINSLFGQPQLEINLLQEDPSGLFNVTGSLQLWKVDLIYTTQATR